MAVAETQVDKSTTPSLLMDANHIRPGAFPSQLDLVRKRGVWIIER